MAGTMIMDGKEVSGPALDRAVIFQSHALMPWLTALGNVAFAVRSRHRDWPRAKVNHAADGVLATWWAWTTRPTASRPNCPAA